MNTALKEIKLNKDDVFPDPKAGAIRWLNERFKEVPEVQRENEKPQVCRASRGQTEEENTVDVS